MKRRDITLGEMQDECIRRSNDGKTCAGCDYSFVCPVALGKEMCPKLWFLIDPPRFNEAQMAALRKSYESGVLSMTRHDGMVCYQLNDFNITLNDNGIVGMLEIGETLDLAELLGNGGAK